MANIHQTMKRVAALYEDLLGTREEITRCVVELQRWQNEQEQLSQEAGRSVRELRRTVDTSLRRLGQAVVEQEQKIAQLSTDTRLGWVIWSAVVSGVVLAIFVEKAFKWLLAQF